ncbi:hypothetical protein ENSA5_54460 [Enhygromyxa salina]|uniref:Uncharacterized protein n=1 Tax=Enhygromyxa salina TaxID=215803 RepID=A0A2S9XF93_9BACT|nr:hypothetical protein ENSA5_54460 [Enhygromyxa salina]
MGPIFFRGLLRRGDDPRAHELVGPIVIAREAGLDPIGPVLVVRQLDPIGPVFFASQLGRGRPHEDLRGVLLTRLARAGGDGGGRPHEDIRGVLFTRLARAGRDGVEGLDGLDQRRARGPPARVGQGALADELAPAWVDVVDPSLQPRRLEVARPLQLDELLVRDVGVGVAARDDLVEQHAKREHVHLGVGGGRGRLLGAHVARGPGHVEDPREPAGVAGGDARGVDARRVAEVEQLDREGIEDDGDVGGREVAVDDAGRVAAGQGAGDAEGELADLAGGELVRDELPVERAPAQQLGDQEGPVVPVGEAPVIDELDDAGRTPEPLEVLGLVEQALLSLGPAEVARGQQLERDLASRLPIPGSEDHAHAALTEGVEQLVAARERLADLWQLGGHCCLTSASFPPLSRTW